MAEIKSTLDLVLERTRHLSLSEEEKREQAQAEMKTRIKALVLKAQDQTMKIEQVEKELNELNEKYGARFQKGLREELLNGIELGGDNRLPVILLRRLGRAETEKLESLLYDYKQSLQKKALEAGRSSLNRLEQSHSISGSAVVPHLALDKSWTDTVIKINEEFNRLLEKEKQGLLQQV
jgi:hypothetical protein